MFDIIKTQKERVNKSAYQTPSLFHKKKSRFYRNLFIFVNFSSVILTLLDTKLKNLFWAFNPSFHVYVH